MQILLQKHLEYRPSTLDAHNERHPPSTEVNLMEEPHVF